MNNQFVYETPICNLRRLISEDKSNLFKIIFDFKNISSKSTQQDQQILKSKINDKIEIKTTINKARAISRKINDIYQIDPTITEYKFDIPIKEEEFRNKITELVDHLIQSTKKTVKINENQVPLFKKLRFLLGTDENLNVNEFKINSEEEAISYLNTEIHHKSIDYLSTHFYDMIENGNYKHFEQNIMIEIIEEHFSHQEDSEETKPKFSTIFNKMKTEYESDKVILSILIRINPEEYDEDMYSFLFEHLDDDFIENNLSLIINIIRHFLFDHIYEPIVSKNKEIKNKIVCEYEGNELSGIITYLKGNKSCEETLKEEIKLSGGGGSDSSHPIINLIKYDSNNINYMYYNQGRSYNKSQESWIEFDFGEKKQINLTSYTIRSNKYEKNGHAHPKTWTISGSNDGNEWTIIDKQVDNPVLNGKYKQHRFEIKNNNNKYFRYIRYHQDDSWDKDKNFQYALCLSCIEFFGTINTFTKKH